MEISWIKELKAWDTYIHNFDCKPFIWKEHLYYAFNGLNRDDMIDGKYTESIRVIKINIYNQQTNTQTIKVPPDKVKIEITRLWKFEVIRDQLYLNTGLLLDLNHTELTVATIDYEPPTFKSPVSDYIFEDKHISYNNRSLITRIDPSSGNELWKIKIKGYLYTPIENKDSYLFFGTAGKGGAFYCVDIETGKIITEYVNQDSSIYAWWNNYILIRNKKMNLVLLNPFHNKEIDTFKLPHEEFIFPLLVQENSLYTIMYSRSLKQVRLAHIHIDKTST